MLFVLDPGWIQNGTSEDYAKRWEPQHCPDWWVIRARALMVFGPYWNCSVSSPKLIAFVRAYTCSKTHETLHTRQNWRKCTSDMGFRSGCGKMARYRHLYNFNEVPLELRFTYMHETRYACRVTHHYLQKSTGTKSQTQQEVHYFEFPVWFFCSLSFSGLVLWRTPTVLIGSS